MNGRTWEKEATERYSKAVLDVLSDGEWHTGDEIETAVLGEIDGGRDGLSVALCLDVLSIAKGTIDRKPVERDGLLLDFVYRIKEGTA